MRHEEEIRDRIDEIESRLVDEDTGEFDEEAYLDEGEQAELNTLYWVLGEDDGSW